MWHVVSQLGKMNFTVVSIIKHWILTYKLSFDLSATQRNNADSCFTVENIVNPYDSEIITVAYGEHLSTSPALYAGNAPECALQQNMQIKRIDISCN